MTTAISSIAPASSEDYSIDQLESVDLNSASTKGLALSQVRFIKAKVLDCNGALDVAGNAIYAAARALVDIKKDVKNKNWKALTDSGVLNMSGRNARDLVAAYESWLSNSDIPQDALSQVSARTLARIGKADAGQRVLAIDKIKKGEEISKTTSDEDKILKFKDILFENIKLKQKISDLEAKHAKT